MQAADVQWHFTNQHRIANDADARGERLRPPFDALPGHTRILEGFLVTERGTLVGRCPMVNGTQMEEARAFVLEQMATRHAMETGEHLWSE